jgi:hypothetical protein
VGRFTSRTSYLFVQNSLFETSAVQTQTHNYCRKEERIQKPKKKTRQEGWKRKGFLECFVSDDDSVLCCVKGPAAMHDGVNSDWTTAKRALIQDTTTPSIPNRDSYSCRNKTKFLLYRQWNHSSCNVQRSVRCRSDVVIFNVLVGNVFTSVWGCVQCEEKWLQWGKRVPILCANCLKKNSS